MKITKLHQSLTEHFTLYEMCIYDPQRIEKYVSKHPGAEVSNYPESDDVVRNLKTLCTDYLEPLRAHLDAPITINSGYRSREYNDLVGGAQNSRHTLGAACDIHCRSAALATKMAAFFMARWAQQGVPFDELIISKRKSVWLHLSFNPSGQNRLYVDFKTYR